MCGLTPFPVCDRQLDSGTIGDGAPQHGLKSNQPFRQRQKPTCHPTAKPTYEEVLKGMKNAKYRGLTLFLKRVLQGLLIVLLLE